VKARALALAAIGISFVSQFFEYASDTRGAMLTRMTDERRYTGMETWGSAGATGWEAHPYAWLVLAVLAIIYNIDAHESAFWTRWGYWLTVIGIFLCTVPSQHANAAGVGFGIGVAAIGVAIWAAIRNRREQRKPPAPPAA
jgi:hypothetical protein